MLPDVAQWIYFHETTTFSYKDIRTVTRVRRLQNVEVLVLKKTKHVSLNMFNDIARCALKIGRRLTRSRTHSFIRWPLGSLQQLQAEGPERHCPPPFWAVWARARRCWIRWFSCWRACWPAQVGMLKPAQPRSEEDWWELRAKRWQHKENGYRSMTSNRKMWSSLKQTYTLFSCWLCILDFQHFYIISNK